MPAPGIGVGPNNRSERRRGTAGDSGPVASTVNASLVLMRTPLVREMVAIAQRNSLPFRLAPCDCKRQLIVKRRSKSVAKPTTISEYLAAVSPEKRAALKKLRREIRTAAPQVEECIVYGIPGFRLNGKYLVGLGASAGHCAFYLGSTVQEFEGPLKSYDTSKGTIRFQPDHPLPGALVRKLVKARIAAMSKRT